MYFQYADPLMFDKHPRSRNNCFIFPKCLDNIFVEINFLLKDNMHSEMSSNAKCSMTFHKVNAFM